MLPRALRHIPPLLPSSHQPTAMLKEDHTYTLPLPPKLSSSTSMNMRPRPQTTMACDLFNASSLTPPSRFSVSAHITPSSNQAIVYTSLPPQFDTRSGLQKATAFRMLAPHHTLPLLHTTALPLSHMNRYLPSKHSQSMSNTHMLSKPLVIGTNNLSVTLLTRKLI